MRPGYPTSCPIGDPDEIIQLAAKMRGTTHIFCEVFARTGYGGFNWAVFLNDRFYRNIVIKEGVAKKFVLVPFDWSLEKQAISLEPIGNWSTIPAETAVGGFHEEYQEDFGDTVLAQWTANQNYEVYDDLDNSFSSWVLAGVRKSFNLSQGRKLTRGKLGLTLTQSGGTNTVTLTRSGVIQASGSRSGDGSVTIVEQNDSGISGSVTIAYTADVDATLRVRWPARYTVEIDSISESIKDDALANDFETRIPNVSAGTHDLIITPYSDTGIAHTPTVVSGVAVADVPDPPTNIVLQSPPGDYSGTKIEWTASADADTYNIYDSEFDEPTDVSTIIGNTAGTTFTLPTIVTPFPPLPPLPPGRYIRRVIVESLKSGVESGARHIIEIEYDAEGNVVLSRPNGIRYSEIEVTAGKTVGFSYEYDRANEKGVASKLAVFLVTEANYAAFWGTGPSTKDIALSATQNRITDSDTVTSPGDGVYYLFVLAETADGIRAEIDKPQGIRLWLDSDVEAAVAGNAEVAI